MGEACDPHKTDNPSAMSDEAARAYVRQVVEAGRVLEQQRWQELAALTPQRALEASNALIEAALMVPLPAPRRTWSGLVEQQRAFHRTRA
jgi:hypothetical protein